MSPITETLKCNTSISTGGTSDIATHEVLDDGKLCEINNTRGNNIAGQDFNKSFLSILNNIFGEVMFNKWQTLKSSACLKLLRIIDGCKPEISTSDEGVYLELPPSLVTYHQEQSGISLDTALTKTKYKEQIEISDDFELYIKSDLLRSLFESILKELVLHVERIVQDSPDIDTIFLVGGLAKSPYVREYIKHKFSKFKMVVPEDPGVAVLKGAVLLGERPQTIDSRLARYSYGICLNADFVKGKHKEEYKHTRDGKELCAHIFELMIEKGKRLKYGDTFEASTCINAKMSDTKKMSFTNKLYQSKQPSPMYTTEEGCKLIGEITQYPPEGGWPDYCGFRIIIKVGEAEFKVYDKDDLGREYETKVDFLESGRE